MKKVVSVVTSLVIGLYGFNLELKQGWQNKGALDDINVSVFKKGDIKSVWYYDKKVENWQVYFPNNINFMNNLPIGIKKLYYIKKGEGFWVNALNDIKIDTNDTVIEDCKTNKFVDTPVNFELNDIKNKNFKLYISDQIVELNFNEKGEANTTDYYGNGINLKFESGLVVSYNNDNKKVGFYKKIVSNDNGMIVAEYGVSPNGDIFYSQLLPLMLKDLKGKDMESYLPYTLYTLDPVSYELFKNDYSITKYTYDDDSKKYVEQNTQDKLKFTINNKKAIEIEGDSYSWTDLGEHNITSYSTKTIQVVGDVGSYDIISNNFYFTDYFIDESYKNKKWEDIFNTDKNISMFNIMFIPTEKIFKTIYEEGNYTYKENNLTLYHKKCTKKTCDKWEEYIILNSETGKVTKKYGYQHIILGSQKQIVKECAINLYRKSNK
jgi:hypothetical protein